MTDLLQWLPKLAGKRILILGDLCLDEYIVGRARRLSREAPVPVLEFQERFVIPGAACNPALNVQAVGGHATVAGVVGGDEAGGMLIQSLRAAGIDCTGVLVDQERETTLKTRVLASHLFPQQVVRIDRQNRSPLSRRSQEGLRSFLRQAIRRTDAVLISDYQSGVVDASLVAYTLDLARASGASVSVDAQGDFSKFKGVSLLRCNREEAEAFLHRSLDGEAAVFRAGEILRRRLQSASVVITRGSDGLSLVDATGAAHHIPVSNPSEVYDVTGAGDTVTALLTLALVAGAPLVDAAHLANIAAGLVVRKLGNATVTQRELAAAVRAAGAG